MDAHKYLFLIAIFLGFQGCKISKQDSTSSDILAEQKTSDPIQYQRSEQEIGRCGDLEIEHRKQQLEAGANAIKEYAQGMLKGAVAYSTGNFADSFKLVVEAIKTSIATASQPGKDRNKLCSLADLDYARYTGKDKDGNVTSDWSLRRIKRSCPPFFPVADIQHVSNTNKEVNLGCSTKPIVDFTATNFDEAQAEKEFLKQLIQNSKKKNDPYTNIKLPEYRYVENGYQQRSWGYSMDCEKGAEYVAGVSFGVTDVNYGIKSILCAKIPSVPIGKVVNCQYLGDNTSQCPAGQFMYGMYVQRGYRNGDIGGFVSDLATNREDDRYEYGDQVKGVSCCSFSKAAK